MRAPTACGTLLHICLACDWPRSLSRFCCSARYRAAAQVCALILHSLVTVLGVWAMAMAHVFMRKLGMWQVCP